MGDRHGLLERIQAVEFVCDQGLDLYVTRGDEGGRGLTRVHVRIPQNDARNVVRTDPADNLTHKPSGSKITSPVTGCSR